MNDLSPEKSNDNGQNGEVRRLEKKIQRMQVLFLIPALAGIAIAIVLRGWKAEQPTGVIHVRGIVVEDGDGRARILIGAPTPDDGRKRKGVGSAAMVVLGPDGSDRVVVGEAPSVPGQQRIGEGVGMTIYDPKGKERGGFGFLGDFRAAMVLDSLEGDAVGAMVDDKTGYAGLGVNYTVAGAPKAVEIGAQKNEVFAILHDTKEKEKVRISVDEKGQPELSTVDVGGIRHAIDAGSLDRSRSHDALPSR